MIKKVSIKGKYGPFDNQEIFFNNNMTNIIGLNDVGKSCLLEILSGSLNKDHLLLDDEGNKLIDPKITIYYDIKYKKDYILDETCCDTYKIYPELDDILNDKTEINLRISTMKEKDIDDNNAYNFYYNSLEDILYTEENINIFNSITKKINELIKSLLQTKTTSDIIKLYLFDKKDGNINFDISDSKIEEIHNKLKLYKEIIIKANVQNLSKFNENISNIIQLIIFLKKLKKFCYHFLDYETFFLPSNSTFTTIKDKYDCSENNENKKDMVLFELFLNSFLIDDEIKNFYKSINSDINDEAKKNLSKNIEDKLCSILQNFFKTNFPSCTNDKIKFQIDIDTKNKIVDIKTKDISDPVSFSDLIKLTRRSDGFKWFLNLFLVTQGFLKKNPNQIIIIDEPEKFLHVSAQRSLSKLLEKIRNEYNFLQIIISTHSPFILNPSLFVNTKIIWKKDNGKSEIYDNITSFVKDDNIDFKDEKYNSSLYPILKTFDLDIEKENDIYTLINKKSVLFVEGESDITIIELLQWLIENNVISCEKQEEKINFISLISKYQIIPLMGKDNYAILKHFDNLNIKYKAFLDEEPNDQFKNLIPNNKNILYLKNEFPKCKSPEEAIFGKIYEERFEKQYKTHNLFWKDIYSKIKNKDYLIDEEEVKNNFKKYKEIIINLLKDEKNEND